MNKEDLNNVSIINPQEKVTSSHSFEDIASIKGKYKTIHVVNANASTKENKKFAFVGETVDGKMEYMDSLKTRGSTTTDKNIYGINRDGSTVEEKQTTEMFATKNPNEALTVTIGQYGVLEVDYLRKSTDGNKFIGSPVSTQNQRPSTQEVKRFMDSSKTTKQEMNRTIDRAEEQTRENGSGETSLRNTDNNKNNDQALDLDEAITMHDGTNTTLRKEADKYDMAPTEYIEEFEKAEGDCASEKIEKVNESINEKNSEERYHEISREERLTPEEEALRRFK